MAYISVSTLSVVQLIVGAGGSSYAVVLSKQKPELSLSVGRTESVYTVSQKKRQ